jgi:preprotein translocase subunit SecD
MRGPAAKPITALMLMAGATTAAAQGLASPAPPAGAREPGHAAGVELLLQGDRADVSRHCLDLEAEAIRRRLDTQGIGLRRYSINGGQLSLAIRDPTRASEALGSAQAERACDDSAGGWEVRLVAGRQILVHQTRAGIDRATRQAMDSARDVIAHRIGALGVPDAIVSRQGIDHILIRVPGLRDATALRPLIARTARLEIRLVDTSATRLQLATGRAAAGSQILPYPEGGEGSRIAVLKEAIITDDMIASAAQGMDQWSGRPVVTLHFTEEGRRRFAQATRDNVGRPFAIILDDAVITAPNVHEPIIGGTAQISGNFTLESARRLAAWLSSGALPVGLVVVEERHF